MIHSEADNLESMAKGLRKHLGVLSESSPVFRDAIGLFYQRINTILSSASTTGNDVAERALNDVTQEIREKIEEIKEWNRIGAFAFHEGDELWTNNGPATVTEIYRNRGRYYVRFQYEYGATGSKTGYYLNQKLKDKEANPERYKKDKEYCRWVGVYMETLKDASVLMEQIQPHIDWRINNNTEACNSMKKLQDQFKWYNPAQLQQIAIKALSTVLAHAKNKKQIRGAIQSALLNCREMILNGQLSVEDAKKNALSKVAPLAASFAFIESHQAIFNQLASIRRSK